MANSSSFGSVAGLQGPGGRGLFDAIFSEPFSDGGTVDLAFVTLVETRLALTEWMNQHSANYKGPMDVTLSQNACRQGAKEASHVHGFLEGLAANYNGNLKTVLAFSSRKFAENETAVLHGRLTETKVGGLAVPNPKKAFIGRTVIECARGVRVCFVGAHFPIVNIATALEEQAPFKADPLRGAKLGMARTLRKVLRRAARRDVVDGNTVLVIQGDLNSRTVLKASGASDVLLELLRDDELQAAVQHQLQLPPGRWREVPEYSGVGELPVTYKFRDRPGYAFERSDSDVASWGAPSLTVGNVLTAAKAVFPSRGGLEGPELYRRTLQDVPSEQLKAWGINFKEGDFRPFRFPACADRIIYWAPDRLASCLSWSLHRGGYEVNHFEKGSDHRPVSLEVSLHIAPELGAGSAAERAAEAVHCDSQLLTAWAKEVCQSDSEGSDGESPVHTSFWGTFSGKLSGRR